MSAGSWVMVASARKNLLNGTFDLDTDTFKMALLASTAIITATTDDAFATVSANEVGTSSTGYATASLTLTLAGASTVTMDIGTDPMWTATTDGFTARYAVIYESGGNMLCFAPLESNSTDVTITTGNTLTVAAAATGVFTLH